MLDLVLRGGTVVDGTGSPGVRSDVGVRNGRVAALGAIDEAARQVIDAEGQVIAPGAVDLHTHYDAQLFWDPFATPSSLHGVTTVIAGNCGFSIAPLDSDDANYMASMLARVEGIPLASLREGVPWTWRTFGEYLALLDERVAVNVGVMAGHTAIRRFVLGADDARTASPDEVATMVEVLHQSLAAGALGLSSSTASSHNDAEGRPVSSRFSDRAELLDLCTAVSAHHGTTLEFIPSTNLFFDDDEVELMTAMSLAADRPLNWNLLNVNTALWEGSLQRLGASDHAAARHASVLALTMPTMSTLRVNFVSGFILDSFPVWSDLFRLDIGDRAAALADPGWRQRLRTAVESDRSTLGPRLADWGKLIVGQTFSEKARPAQGRTLADVAAELGEDPFDCLLDLVLADGLCTVIVIPPWGNDDESWRLRSDVWRDPRIVIGGSDSGAHLDMIDNFAYTTSLLGPLVRRGFIELEEAVRLVTDVPARLYGLRGRGRIIEGWHADMMVFDPASIGPGEVHMRDDLPGGASRLFAEAHGIGHVFVNGRAVVEEGQLRPVRPGAVLRSGRDSETVRASGRDSETVRASGRDSETVRASGRDRRKR